MRENSTMEFAKELYDLYEGRDDLHPEIPETRAAETSLDKVLCQLDKTLMFELDSLIGNIARAYEIQGFFFGFNCGKAHI